MTQVAEEKVMVPELRLEEFKPAPGYSSYLFEEVFLFSSGKNIKQAEAAPEYKIPCVRYGELYHLYGEVINKIINRTNLDESELTFSEGDEILLPSAGEDPLDIGSASALTLKNVAIGRTINVLKPKGGIAYSHIYVSYYINQKLRKKISTMARGASISNVYNSDLKKLKINLPEIDEQQKIASFLTAVDEKLNQLRRKRDCLQAYKRGVLQKIFSQDIRFTQDDGSAFPDWEERELNEVLEPIIREVDKPKENYLAIGIRSHMKGTFQKPDSEPDKIAMDKLFVVKDGDLVVNITFAWEGAIAIVKPEDDGGLVSHRFPTYLFKDSLLRDYFRHVITQKRFKFTLDLISPGGAGRNRVLSKKDFLKIRWSFPSVDEQRKISDFLASLDAKILEMDRKVSEMEAFKKGLLQKMLV